MTFSDKILIWYARNSRQLPWRNTKDPYHIWLSEIIMQQTRIAQGLPYYQAFIREYPSIFDLASANESQVLKLWQGLGYYSRARNLHATARHIAFERNGMFPKTYNELLKLKGIGDYTASAIASICYGEARPVIDGNVYRVLSRCFDVDLSIQSSKGKKFFKNLATEIMAKDQIGDYNQGVMEIGATVCLPKSPSCDSCPLNDQCLALARGTIDVRPVKKKRTPARIRHFDYLIYLDPEGRTYLQKRTGNDIWKNMFEFPLIESEQVIDTDSLQTAIHLQIDLPQAQEIVHVSEASRIHKLSHQHLNTRFWIVKTHEEIPEGIPWESIDSYPVPVLIHDTIQALKNSYF